MKTRVVLTLMLAFAMTAPAQMKTIHFKKLQECLPSVAFKGFERKKPTGSTQTQMGMSMSSASVRYEEQLSDTATNAAASIEIEIQDMVGMPYALMPYAWMQEYENETEDGYEKTVTVKGKYKGVEKGSTGDSKNLNLTFGVANRFIVTITVDQRDDAKLFGSVVDAVQFDKLEKLMTETK